MKRILLYYSFSYTPSGGDFLPLFFIKELQSVR